MIPGRRWRPLLVLSAVFGATACFTGHLRDRPPTWPASSDVPGGACPDLSGRYEDEALPDPFVSQRVWLSELLSADAAPASPWAWMRPPPAAGHQVELGRFERDPATALVRYRHRFGEDQQPTTLPFAPGTPFECREGAVVVTLPAHREDTEVCGDYREMKVTLWRAVDGTLVARVATDALCVGRALVSSWSAEWYRFRQLTPAGGGT